MCVKAGPTLNCGRKQLVLPDQEHIKVRKVEISDLIIKNKQTKTPLKLLESNSYLLE